MDERSVRSGGLILRKSSHHFRVGSFLMHAIDNFINGSNAAFVLLTRIRQINISSLSQTVSAELHVSKCFIVIGGAVTTHYVKAGTRVTVSVHLFERELKTLKQAIFQNYVL